MTNIINITNNVDSKSLVLLDEIGAGTDPDEGSALAQSIIEHLVDKGSFGVITTHYSKLKEYAYSRKEIINASMQFDPVTFAPLYKINIGMPGSSNAIEIASLLGLDSALASKAIGLLTDNKISFENVIRQAEKSRQEANNIKDETAKLKAEVQLELDAINKERQKFNREKEKFNTEARIESRRVVHERLQEAEDLVEQIRIMFDKAELDSGDLINARTIRNKLEDKKYSLEEMHEEIVNYKPIDLQKLAVLDRVYYKKMQSECVVNGINIKKKEIEVLMGSIKTTVKANELFFVTKNKVKVESSVSIKRELTDVPETRLNIIGENVLDALPQVERFIDNALVNNIPELQIVHGKGLRILSTAIHALLKRHTRVESYRFGKYGEGEHGVTIVKLK